jgi:hypothetical protein
MSFIYRRVINCMGYEVRELNNATICDLPIFLFLMTDHLKRLTYKLSIVSAEKMMTALIPYFFLSSCSGSAAQLRKVVTSLAIWEVVAGVPVIYCS